METLFRCRSRNTVSGLVYGRHPQRSCFRPIVLRALRRAAKQIIGTGIATTESKKRNMAEETTITAKKNRPSYFKYYIHDGNEACRLQLLGGLLEADVTELNGCWRTVKTTLKNRKLIIDVRALQSADDAGRGWLASMAGQGVSFMPETFSPSSVFQPEEPSFVRPRFHAFARIVALLRGYRVADSSTQAQ